MADNGPEHDVWTDPVSHLEVDPDRSRHSSFYNGVTYHFSDATSKQVFDEDPQLWVSTAHASETSANLPPVEESE